MKELFDYLEDGIELLVMLQYGLLDGQCYGCSPSMQEMMHCGYVYEEEAEQLLYVNTSEKEYSHCPISMIPKVVYDLYDQYTFIKEFNTQMNPETTSLLFWWFVKTYKNKTNMVESKIQKEQTKNKKKQ
jgi:hypothetical protein